MEDTQTQRFSLILDKTLREQVDAAARKSDRSAGAFVRTLIREGLKQRDQRRADQD
jgi:metal-responsive CopG/Arc/MetJ family transcriptional regulator